MAVVPYQYSTSNRNYNEEVELPKGLFLISILHQTATNSCGYCSRDGCSLSVFYIKPQRTGGVGCLCLGCSLSVFYIKPQLLDYR